MAGRFRITCITKPDPESPVEHITHVGGMSGWTLDVETVMSRIESKGAGHEDFFVHVGNAEADVIVVKASAHRRKHIRTTPDGTPQDNLLKLGKCP